MVLKVYDAMGKEAIKVVNLTQKAKDSASVITDDPRPIPFYDKTVKSILLKLCDKNNDGEISYAEASRVEELPDEIFKLRTRIRYVEQLQYFTSLKSIPFGAFAHCARLIRVLIPESVTNIEAHSFVYCTSLENVVIPKGVTRIGESAFQGCEELTRIEIPEGVTQIEINAFWESGLTAIKLPSTLKRIGACSFPRGTVITVPKGYADIYRERFLLGDYIVVEE